METGTNMPVNELTQGPEQESELSASIEQCLSLAQEILASIDKALSVAQSRGCPNLAVGPPDSPPSPRSPRSEITWEPFKAERTEMISKKWKTQPKQTSPVKLGAGPEAVGPLDDGYSWRKYGEKGIRGAEYPRSYYKCTQRDSQGCLGCPARKQAQQSDDNPAIFDVTYTGTHTCCQKPSPPADAASSFIFSSQPSTPDNSCKRSFTEAFTSSVTSELNCFSSSPGRKSRYGETPSLQSSESFPAMVSALESLNNCSVFDLDFPYQSSDPEDPKLPF